MLIARFDGRSFSFSFIKNTGHVIHRESTRRVGAKFLFCPSFVESRQ